MNQEQIYAILASKPHNQHYLKRYHRFIIECESYNKNTTLYTENHHICPKAIDLFPEYTSFREHPWNKVKLTDKQHFIAHWMLWRAYSGSQAYAFNAMANNQTPKQSGRLKKKINSKTYELLKIEARKLLSNKNKGMANYKDKDGNSVHCKTTDPRVLSGELQSTTKGRKQPWRERSEEQIAERNQNIRDSKWKEYPIRKTKIYFLTLKIEISYTKGMPEILPYLEQGWGFIETPEHRSYISIKSNLERSPESRKRAGIGISNAIKKKRESGQVMRRALSIEDQKKLRRNQNEPWRYIELCFNVESKEFTEIDILDIKYPWVKCFTTNESCIIFDADDNKRFFNKNIPCLPPGYFEEKSNHKISVLVKETNSYEKISARLFDPDLHIKIIINQSNGRLSFKNKYTGKKVYWNEELKALHGVPSNFI